MASVSTVSDQGQLMRYNHRTQFTLCPAKLPMFDPRRLSQLLSSDFSTQQLQSKKKAKETLCKAEKESRLAHKLLENDKIKARREALKEKMNELSSFRKRKPLSESNKQIMRYGRIRGTKNIEVYGEVIEECLNSGEEEKSVHKKPYNSEIDYEKRIEASETDDRANDVFDSINQNQNCNEGENIAKSTKASGLRGKSRFAALAATIDKWESEDIQALPSYQNKSRAETHPSNSNSRKDEKCILSKVTPKINPKPEDVNINVLDNSSVQATKIQPNDNLSSQSKPAVTASVNKDQTETNVCVKNKISIWDKAVVATLAQGYTKSPSASKITYEYPTLNKRKNPNFNNVSKPKIATEPVKELAPSPVCLEKLPSDENKIDAEVSVSDRISMFSNPKKRKSNEDPALMSLSARVALFEKAMDKPQQPSTHSCKYRPSDVSFKSISKPTYQACTSEPEESNENQIVVESNSDEENCLPEEEYNLYDKEVDAPTEEDNLYIKDIDVPEEEDDLYDRECDSLQFKKVHESSLNSKTNLNSIVEEVDVEYSGEIDDDVAEACGEIDKMLDAAMEDDLCEMKGPETKKVEELITEIITKPGQLYPSLILNKDDTGQKLYEQYVAERINGNVSI
ncbi:hypothetical protein GQR58_005574 [Nymphon striatum]|nr:hypothetical protein GQR58_005574 [Nymphon striatum]